VASSHYDKLRIILMGGGSIIMNEVVIVNDEEDEQDKTSKALDDVLSVLKAAKLRTQDLILLYGNLGYSIGASIEGVTDSPGPSVDELQKTYFEKPSVGVALMLQGILTTSWHDDYLKQNKIE
jgi:hypothetical protein